MARAIEDMSGREFGPDIAHLIGEVGAFPPNACTVSGALDLSGMSFEQHVSIAGWIFLDDVLFADSEFKAGLTISKCKFKKRLVLTNAVVDGALTISDVQAGERGPSGAVSPQAADLTGIEVTGDIRMEKLEAAGNVVARGMIVGGSVSFSSIKLQQYLPPGLPLGYWPPDNSAIVDKLRRQMLVLDHSKIGGTLAFYPAETLSQTFQQTSRQEQTQSSTQILGSLSAEGIKVGGDVLLGNLCVAGNLDLSGATVEGRLQRLEEEPFTPSQAQFRQTPPSTRARRPYHLFGSGDTLAIGGSLILDSATIQRRITLRGLEVHGSLALGSVKTSDVELSDFRIDGDVSFVAAKCQIVRLQGHLESAEPQHYSRCRTLDFGSCHISGQIDLERLSVDGRIDFNGSTVGSFVAAIESGSARCGALRAVSSYFKSYVMLSCLKVIRDERAFAADVEGDDSGVLFVSCQFDNGLAFWSSSLRRSDPRTFQSERVHCGWIDKSRRCEIAGNLEIRGCEIKGDIDLTGIRINAAEQSGNLIRVDQTTVTGAILFGSPESFVKRTDEQQKAHQNARLLIQGERVAGPFQRAGDSAAAFRRRDDFLAEAGSLSLSNGVHARDIDLSGLRLASHVHAEGIIVTDEFALHPEKFVDASAQISGALRLNDAGIGTMRVSDRSFDSNKSEDASTDGIVLKGATITRFIVVRGTSGGFPVPLDLDDLTITHWEFPDSTNESSDDVQDYLDVLANDKKLRFSTYKSVERGLRDQNRDREADKIYKAMMHRAFRDPKSRWRPPPLFDQLRSNASPPERFWYVVSRARYIPFWLAWHCRLRMGQSVRWLLHFVVRHALGYWTNPWPTLGVIVALMLFTLGFVAPHARNFEPAPLAYLKPGPKDQCNENWGLSEATWLTLRYHVPVIGLQLRSDWQPRDTPGIHVSPLFFAPLIDCKAGGAVATSLRRYSPEDWLGLMSVLNFVLWPLFVWLLIRWVQKRD